MFSVNMMLYVGLQLELKDSDFILYRFLGFQFFVLFYYVYIYLLLYTDIREISYITSVKRYLTKSINNIS